MMGSAAHRAGFPLPQTAGHDPRLGIVKSVPLPPGVLYPAFRQGPGGKIQLLFFVVPFLQLFKGIQLVH